MSLLESLKQLIMEAEGDDQEINEEVATPEPEVIEDTDWEAEYLQLKAITDHYLPEGVDLDVEMDRVGTNRNGEVMYSPSQPQEPQAAPKKAFPKAPPRKAVTAQTPNFDSMNEQDLAKYYQEVVVPAHLAGREI